MKKENTFQYKIESTDLEISEGCTISEDTYDKFITVKMILEYSKISIIELIEYIIDEITEDQINDFIKIKKKS